jgi:hypothetical protein
MLTPSRGQELQKKHDKCSNQRIGSLVFSRAKVLSDLKLYPGKSLTKS